MKRVLLLFLICLLFVTAGCGPKGEQITYTVSQEQWELALGEGEHRKEIYNNVTIDVHIVGNASEIAVAVSNGALMILEPASGNKTLCTKEGNTYYTYVFSGIEQKWTRYTGKADGIDDYLNTYLPEYVDVAMTGLQEKFGNAVYNEASKSYTITAESGQMKMECTLKFENGQLSRLDTNVLRNGVASAICVYDIGKTVVESPKDFEIAK
jgi:uncharacterized lipoprotein YehR (DUF1307 family)